MGQTQGGSAGNLKLLEKIKEQQAEIEALKEKFDLTYKRIEGTNCVILYNSISATLAIRSSGLTIESGNVDTNIICKLPNNVKISNISRTTTVMTSAWVPTDIANINVEEGFGANISVRCANSRTNAVIVDFFEIPIGSLEIQQN